MGPSVVVVGAGKAKLFTTTTARNHTFIFGQKGLMAGVGIQGWTITKVNR